MFQVSRWLAGRGAPDQVKMQQGVWVAPADNLQAAQRETDYFTEPAAHRSGRSAMDGPLSTLADVEDPVPGRRHRAVPLRLPRQLQHRRPQRVEAASWQANSCVPSQIIGPAQTGLRKSKPVVFLNACYGGQVGVGLTQLGGWAQRFIDSGASVFIGSLWAINDKLAAQFAQEFYNRLWGVNAFAGKPQPLGQAFHEARMAIKAIDEANPTWLAYVLYGDPYGQVILGPGA